MRDVATPESQPQCYQEHYCWVQLLLATVFSFSSSSGPLASLGAHIRTACSNIHAVQELEEMLLLKQLSE